MLSNTRIELESSLNVPLLRRPTQSINAKGLAQLHILEIFKK